MKNRLHIFLLLSSIVFSSFTMYSQEIPVDSLYLGQTPPGDTQKLFSLSITAGYSAVERIAFSSDGNNIYYSELNINYNYVFTSARIKYYSFYDNRWNGPFVLFEGYYSPSLSVDGNTMYFQTRNPREVWYSEKNDTAWGTPSKFSDKLDLISNLQQTDNGTYFCTSNSIRLSKLIITPSDTVIESLGSVLNSTDDRNYLYMAKDESYAIVYTFQGGSSSLEGRALISYHKQDGSWTNLKQMGFGGWAPNLSPDNKYLFYSSIVGSSYATYWIRVDNIIDSLKYTNFAPYAKWSVSAQTAAVNKLFNFTIPDSIFYDDDNDTLTYSATLNTGASLPGWLKFDTLTHTFSGTPLASRELPLYVKITAKDSARASGSCQFALYIIDPPSSVEGSNLLPNELRIEQNYPNPFNPTTTIRYSLPKSSFVKLTIYNTLGQKIRTLKDSYQSAGEHSVVWDAHDERNNPVSSGIYFYRIETNNQILHKKMLLIK